MTMSMRLNDPQMLQAIGILAQALDAVTGPDRFECLMAASALRQAAETGSESALDVAREAFDALEGDMRSRIQKHAAALAAKHAGAEAQPHPGDAIQPTTDPAPGRGLLSRPAPSPPVPPRPALMPAPKPPANPAPDRGRMNSERKW